jgi:hypothetical protein
MSEEIVKWSEEELLEIVRAVPLSVLKDNSKMQSWYKEKGYNKVELAAILTVIATSMPGFKVTDLSESRKELWQDMTFGELYDFFERAQVQFIVIHRVNYLLHYLMIEVYDLLEKEKRLRFMVKKHSKKAEEVWDGYEKPRQRTCEKSAWYTLQDHLRITQDILYPYLDKVYESLRDYFIRLGWKDIEVKARIELALLLAKVCRHSFKAFFKDFKDACGVDFAPLFKSADLSQMVRYFSMMAESLGIKTEKDKFGLPDIQRFDVDANIRVKWAWDKFIKALQDDDLMDESALRAIELNPKTKADYERQLAEDALKQLDEGIDKLSDKFKVTRSK